VRGAGQTGCIGPPLELFQKFGDGRDDGSADQVGMTVQRLAGGMHDQVAAETERLLAARRCKRVVGDNDGPCSPRLPGMVGDVDQPQKRVAGGLDPDHRRATFKCRRKRVIVRLVDEDGLDPAAVGQPLDEPVGPSVAVMRRDDGAVATMVSGSRSSGISFIAIDIRAACGGTGPVYCIHNGPDFCATDFYSLLLGLRPPEAAMTDRPRVITASIPGDMAARLDAAAAATDRSRSWIVRQALAEWLAEHQRRHELTLEALRDVDEGRTLSQEEVEGHLARRRPERAGRAPGGS